MDPDSLDNLDDIQARLNRSVREEADTEDKLDLIELLRDLTADGSPVPYDEVLVEARMRGMAKASVDRLLTELQRDKMVEAKAGRYQLLE